MPIVQIDLLTGRTVEQKRKMVKEVTDAISKNLNCDASAVTIIIREMTKEHLANGGILRVDKE